MTDLESRVREALDSAAGSAPPATGLAEAARRRRRGHRRRSVALTAVGVAVVLVAGVAGVRSLQETSVVPVPDRVAPGDATSAAPSPEPDPDPVPPGWRVETWRGVSVEVPDDWAAGSRSDWCAGRAGPEVPVVERPHTTTQLVECHHPHASLGLSLGSAAAYDPVYPSGHVWRYQHGDSWDGVEVYVDGSWLGHWYDGRHLVQVNAADRATVERVLGSVRVDGEAPAGD